MSELARIVAAAKARIGRMEFPAKADYWRGYKQGYADMIRDLEAAEAAIRKHETECTP